MKWLNFTSWLKRFISPPPLGSEFGVVSADSLPLISIGPDGPGGRYSIAWPAVPDNDNEALRLLLDGGGVDGCLPHSPVTPDQIGPPPFIVSIGPSGLHGFCQMEF